jgi:hypothetical protein
MLSRLVAAYHAEVEKISQGFFLVVAWYLVPAQSVSMLGRAVMTKIENQHDAMEMRSVRDLGGTVMYFFEKGSPSVAARLSLAPRVNVADWQSPVLARAFYPPRRLAICSCLGLLEGFTRLRIS